MLEVEGVVITRREVHAKHGLNWRKSSHQFENPAAIA
jgi:hypothetical protein